MNKTFNRIKTITASPNDVDAREKVELFFSGRKLADLDTFSKSDPQVRLYQYAQQGGQKLEVGKTEIIWDSLNPEWQKTFELDFIFETKQSYYVEVVDVDDKHGHQIEMIGTCEFEMGQLMGANQSMLLLKLKHPTRQKNGTLIIRGETVSKKNDLLTMNFSCFKLDNFSFWKTGSPFLKFYKPRMNQDIINMMEQNNIQTNSLGQNDWVLVHQTEYKKDTTTPDFKPFKISASKLCSGDYRLPVKVEVWNYKSSGTHKYKAETYIKIENIIKNGEAKWEFYNPQKKKNAGFLSLDFFDKEENFSFLDYLRGGLNISVIVCIDFTASNQNPHHPSSLHYQNPNKPNQYQSAILSVCEILLNYDTDKMIPTYGFGAKTPMGPGTSHFFPCSMDFNNCEGHGVQGVFELYTRALTNVQLSGPTNFGPLLKEVNNFTEQAYKSHPDNYTVLLILTDGTIHDQSDTINEIVRGSHLPLSIIIVGVGSADFQQMEHLDSDDQLLRGSRGTAIRDIVQFVPYKQFENSSALLASEVLQELPGQVTGFYRKTKRKPNKPIAQDVNNTYNKQATTPYIPSGADLYSSPGPNQQQQMVGNAFFQGFVQPGGFAGGPPPTSAHGPPPTSARMQPPMSPHIPPQGFGQGPPPYNMYQQQPTSQRGSITQQLPPPYGAQQQQLYQGIGNMFYRNHHQQQ